MSKYCWMFGEHKSDPCKCGWSSKTDPERWRSKFDSLRAAVVSWSLGKNLTQSWDHYDAMLGVEVDTIEAEGK